MKLQGLDVPGLGSSGSLSAHLLLPSETGSRHLLGADRVGSTRGPHCGHCCIFCQGQALCTL